METLQLSLYDENTSVRHMGVKIMTRTAPKNATLGNPVLNKLMMRIRSCLQYRGVTMREAAELLSELTSEASSLLRLHFRPLMKVLLRQLTQASRFSDTRSAQSLFRAIADVVNSEESRRVANGRLLRQYRRKLLPLLVKALEVEQSESGFKIAAMRTLARVVQDTEYTIKPYFHYPKLLRSIVRILRMDVDMEVRVEAQALLGAMGAVDPDDVEKDVSLTPVKEELGVTYSAAAYYKQRIDNSKTGPDASHPMYSHVALPFHCSWGVSDDSPAVKEDIPATEDRPLQEGERLLA